MPPQTEYIKTAKDIISNAISSAIFIDDNLAVPFKAKQEKSQIGLSRALFNSFTKSNVSLDFFKYNQKRKWRDSKEFLFKTRDLLVLDWQLDNNDIEENTLQILNEAINTPSLHFICIYTSKPPNEFPDIAYSIKAYFSQFDDSIIKTQTEEIISILDSELPGGFSKEIEKEFKKEFKEYTLYNYKSKNEKYKFLKYRLNQILGEELEGLFYREIGIKFKMKQIDALEAFGYGVNKEYLASSSQIPHRVNAFMDDKHNKFLLLDSTLILLTNKSSPRPASLHSYFTNALLKSSGNFLSLLSLDLKNILKRSSGFINKELDMIDEVAFFYHKDNVHPKEAFFEFILELWKSNLTSIIFSQNHLIKLFDEKNLKNYREKKKIDKKLKNFKKKGNSETDIGLAKLNYYYNIIQNRNINDFLRFGDIFNIIDVKGNPTDEYLLCITAHCDCLYVENIKNLFYFVRGRVIDKKEGLSEGDTGNNSFIVNNKQEIICIKWSNKPFTIYLEDNNILRNAHTVRIGKSEKSIIFCSSLKENYAQRIANNAFSHPMRVGIFFAKKI